MKRRHIILINIIFLCLILLSAGTVYQFMTGNKPLGLLQHIGRHHQVTVSTANCSPKPPLNLDGAKDPHVRKLAVYQQACHSFITNTLMIFVGTPTSAQSAASSAQQTAAALKELAKYKIRPLVIAEPTDYATSQNIDFGVFAHGDLTPWIDQYFSKIKSLGVTEQEIGIWNPLPEANLPYWKNNQAQFFAPAINSYVKSLRTYYPQAQTSIMLNAATYQTNDFTWQNGDYVSLLPYIKGITPGSITYAGLEGFPWVARQGGNGAILNAAEFLNPSVISETADYLKTKQIWFNTGTFAEKYALDPSQIVYLSPQQRKAVLSTVDEQAKLLQKKGYTIAINMFAQDKSKSAEETNWSYWNHNAPFNSLSTPVLTEFVGGLNSQKIDFWLFDQ